MFSRIIKFFGTNHLNILMTLYVNFHFLPFRQAYHLPIYVYGKLRFLQLEGKINICSPLIYSGMIRLNKNTTAPCNSNSDMEIVLYAGGKILFNGKAIISSGSKLIANMGVIEFGENVFISSQVTIQSFINVKIGNNVMIAHRAQVLDTNSHAVIDLETKRISRTMTPIVIGDYCWIGNNSSVMQGVTLPCHTIVASNSLVNKTLNIQAYSIIGGIPAICLNINKSRIGDNLKLEGKMHHFFHDNPNASYFQYDDTPDKI